MKVHTAATTTKKVNRNVLCPSVFDDIPVGVVLSEDDSLVPSAAVARHLSRFAHSKMIVHVLEGHSHAEFIAHPESCKKIGEVFRQVEGHFRT
eukprot:1185630-Prorocentrum_minimum.AAC.2